MKRYLITGASRGIGRAIAQNLAGADVELLLHGRDTVALAEVCEAVKPRCAQVVRLIHALAAQGEVRKVRKVKVKRVDFGDFSKTKLIAWTEPQAFEDRSELGVQP